MKHIPSATGRRPLRFRLMSLLLALAMLPATSLANTEPRQAGELPTFGGVGGGLISEQQEAEIGQQVMQSIRGSADQIRDPLVTDYLNSIVYRLAPSVPLNDKEFDLIVIDNPGINAFAVPGNIIGVNGGLFLNARTEQQFASVIAHELAHLSQRHFARRMQQQETSTPLTIAGMIAGILLTAVTQSDAGIAAIAGTQAMAVQNMLQYSRANEQEADRVGIDIMADAGMDPRGMPEMFEQMMRQNRLQGNRVPEYLSTHPLTQSRVSDSRSRAESYPDRGYTDALEYHLVRARLQVRYAESGATAVRVFEDYVQNNDAPRENAVHYGLAVAYLRDEQPEKALSKLESLLADRPGRITYEVTRAEALMELDRHDEARRHMRDMLQRNPGNFPISVMLADIERTSGNPERAADHLRTLTRDFPDREDLWLKLADAEGQARNIVGVHRARAEYDILTGDLEAAQRQLRQAQEKTPPEAPQRQVVTERLSQVSQALTRRNR